jgi:hypothetical protein
MGFMIEQEPEQVQAAYHFQVSAELLDVQLLDCTASVSETNARLEGPLRIGLQWESGVLDLSEGGARLWVRIDISGDPADAPEQPERHYFEVAGRYALSYGLRSGYTPSQEQVDAFRAGNAVFHCWPYSRELVQNMTARMGLLIPPLPFLRLAPKITRKISRKRAALAKTGDEGGRE